MVAENRPGDALARQVALDLAHVGPEAQREQLVGLVEDQHAHLLQVDAPRLQVVEQPPGRADHRVHAALEGVELRAVRRAAVDRDRLHAAVPAHARDLLLDLHGELARGRHHQELRNAQLRIDQLDGREPERAGLAAAGDGLRDQVAAGAHHRHDAALHLHRRAPAEVGDALADVLGEAVEAGERLELGLGCVLLGVSVGVGHGTGSILSRVARSRTASVIPFTSSPRSIASIGCGLVQVAGLRGIRKLQQSSSGSIEIGKLPMRWASATISALSRPTRGRSTGRVAARLIVSRFPRVCDETWPSDVAGDQGQGPLALGDRLGGAQHEAPVEHDARIGGGFGGELPLQLAERHQVQGRRALPEGQERHQIAYLVLAGAARVGRAVEVHVDRIGAALQHEPRRHGRVDPAGDQAHHPPGGADRHAARSGDALVQHDRLAREQVHLDPEIGRAEVDALAGALHHARTEPHVELVRAQRVPLVDAPRAHAEALERAAVDQLVDRALDRARARARTPWRGRRTRPRTRGAGAPPPRPSRRGRRARSGAARRAARRARPAGPARAPGSVRRRSSKLRAVAPLEPDLGVMDHDLHAGAVYWSYARLRLAARPDGLAGLRSASPRIARMGLRVCAGYFWQRGQKWVLRWPSMVRLMRVPHSRQGSPPRA